MGEILAALGGFLLGVGVTVAVARYFFLLGWEKGRDDRALDPGAVTGQLPSAGLEEVESSWIGPIPVSGRSSGKHALEPFWPDSEPADATDAITPEVRA